MAKKKARRTKKILKPSVKTSTQNDLEHWQDKALERAEIIERHNNRFQEELKIRRSLEDQIKRQRVEIQEAEQKRKRDLRDASDRADTLQKALNVAKVQLEAVTALALKLRPLEMTYTIRVNKPDEKEFTEAVKEAGFREAEKLVPRREP